MTVDWITVQNGSDMLLPPALDLDAAGWRALNTASSGRSMGTTRATLLPGGYDPSTSAEDNDHTAPPIDDGQAFIGGRGEDADEHIYSWGNPTAVQALDGNIAVVAFESYLTQPGTLAYTVDAGLTWTEVPFDPAAACGGGAYAYDFFDTFRSLSLIRSGSGSGWTDVDGDGEFDASVDDWRMDILVATGSLKKVSDVGTDSMCSLAHITLQSGAEHDWSWVPLPYAGGKLDGELCRVGGGNLAGVVASPWSNDAFIWGSYASRGAGATNRVERGGVCRIALDGTHARQRVLSPVGSTAFDLDVVDVEPNPMVAGELLISTSTADPECHKLYREQVVEWNAAHPDGEAHPYVNECPRSAPPLIAQQVNIPPKGAGAPGSVWSVVAVPGAPAALVGSDSAWLPHARGSGEPTFYYAGTSGGIWEATLSW